MLLVFGHRRKLSMIRMLASLDGLLKERGINLFLAVEDRGEFERYPNFSADRLFVVKGLTDWRSFRGKVTGPLKILRLLRVCKACNADLLHAYHLSTFPFVWAASKLAGIPHMVVMQNVYKDGVRRYRKFMLQRAENILAVSEYMLDLAREVAGNGKNVRGFVAHNSLDAESFVSSADCARIPAELRPPEGNVVVGMVSTMDAQKDPQFLLRVARRVLEFKKNVTFMFVGRFPDGEYEKQTKELARRLEIEENVIFTGQRHDVSSYFAIFDILAHPSPRRPEAFGLVLIEAMAHGKPVVAARTGGIPEIVVDGETGLLCAPNYEEEFSEALLTLIENPALRDAMGQKGMERARKCFDVESAAEKMALAFRECVRLGSDA